MTARRGRDGAGGQPADRDGSPAGADGSPAGADGSPADPDGSPAGADGSLTGHRLTVGLVRGLYGLHGAVRVEILTDDPERFAEGSVLHPDGADDRLTVAWTQRDGPGILVRFRERPTREAVEELRDRYLEAAPRPGPSEAVYWHELTGVPVSTTTGEVLGSVEDVFRAGGAEVLVVRSEARGEVLVPVVASIIPEFAPRQRRIVVDAEALGLDTATRPRKPRGRRTRRAATGAEGPSPERNEG